MDEKKSVVKLTIVLFKTSVQDYSDACEKIAGLKIVNIKDSYNFEGRIIYCESKKTVPKWKALVDELSESQINLSENTSNKVAILLKVKDRFMGIVFGYGKALLREDKIEHNFGLKTALNTISSDQMRSVQSATIEDMIVSTHRQASQRTSQEEFDLNYTRDILRSVTGKPYDEMYGNTISGKDALSVALSLNIEELEAELTKYLEAYQDDRYKRIGFEWVDNINEIRDPEMKNRLNEFLSQQLINKSYSDLYVTPPEVIDLEQIEGLCFSGIGKNLNEPNNYSYSPNFDEYVDSLEQKNKQQVLCKLRRDKIYSIDSNGFTHTICNMYSAIVWQCLYKRKTYILWNGSWYYVEKRFVEEVKNYLQEIPLSNLVLPKCHSGESEGAYNVRIANNNATLCLMDKKLIRVAYGPKQIESCDLFSSNKEMIHVKKRDSSSQLSHLFSQGRVAVECFLTDTTFRKMVYDLVKDKLGNAIFDYTEKPKANEFEIVYAMIAEKGKTSLQKLPFFSQVNLMLTCQSLDRTQFKYSVCFIEED